MNAKSSTIGTDSYATPVLRKELDVLERVRVLMREAPYHCLKQVACDFHEGVLTLRGRVPSFYLKQIAQELVANLVGVEVLRNHLDVE